MTSESAGGIELQPGGPAQAAGQTALGHAIDWAVRLASGSATPEDRRVCEQWRQAHPQHEQAWQQVQAVEQAFQAVPATRPHLAFDTLQGAERGRKKNTGRRRAMQLLGWGTLTVGVGGVLSQWLQTSAWLQRAHYATALGERRRERLSDGSLLQVNTGSELEQRFSPLRRVIALHTGEVFVDTGRDADSLTGRRPFWLETPEVQLEALGTRFRVQRIAGSGNEPGQTVLQVSEGRVAVHVPAGTASTPMVIAEAGDTLRIRAGAQQIERVANTGLDTTAWLEGVLVAKQMRLDAFVAELARYRRQPLRCDPAVAAWRVSGVFRLDGPDPVGRALQVLARTLPVRIVALEGGEQVVVST